ncbi:MAG: prepilin-type cleavage/methylation domain-containing protein [Rhodopirellula sp.]|nr:prepilin-type cleavage/methylation domain-containing protein [Rhodopirellula sp.]
MARSSGWNLIAAVIAGVVLVALLFISLPRERVNTRGQQCAARLRNIAFAAIQHDSSHTYLPGYIKDFGIYSGEESNRSAASNRGVARHKKLGTWAVTLLAWLDAQVTYEHWTQDRYPIILADSRNILADSRNQQQLESTVGTRGSGFYPLATPNLSIFQCPSRPVNVSQNAPNSMVYNNGLAWPADRPASGKTPNINDGVGNNKYNITKIDPVTGEGIHTGESANIGLDDLADGKSCTILFSENIQALPWHRVGLIDSTDLVMKAPNHKDVRFNLEMPKALAAQYTQGMVWHYEDSDAANLKLARQWNKLGGTTPARPHHVAPIHRINGCRNGNRESLFNLRMENAVAAADLARPSSAHTSGVNAAFADGSTRFITENIDYRVYQALMTPRGNKSSVPYPRFVLPAQFRK